MMERHCATRHRSTVWGCSTHGTGGMGLCGAAAHMEQTILFLIIALTPIEVSRWRRPS
jgi:hypothetical protein